jgi:hypothetical protein
LDPAQPTEIVINMIVTGSPVTKLHEIVQREL